MDDRSRLSVGEAFSFQPASLKVGIVGAGRVGRAFAAALSARGHSIPWIAASTRARATAAAETFGAQATDAAAAAASADLVVIAVPDDALAGVVGKVAPAVQAGTWIVHTCGRFGCAPLAACGDRVAAAHPAAPIAGDSSLQSIAFGVTCSDAVWPFASWLAAELGGFPVRIPEERRVLYHAALVIGSNFTTALAADAFALAGAEMVLPLLHATVENLERMPAADALTGPVVRGDAGTIRAHLEALDKQAPYLRDAYVAVSRRIVAQARAAGRLDGEGAARIEEALAT